MINSNEFIKRINVLHNFRTLKSNFIISGGIVDLFYLENITKKESPDIALHIFDYDTLYVAKDMFNLEYFNKNNEIEIYVSKSDVLVLYFHHEKKEVEHITYSHNGFEYKIVTPQMRKEELQLKLNLKYSNPIVDDNDELMLRTILKLIFHYSNM